MTRRIKVACLIASMLLLSGCWDAKSIQDVNYVASLGLDYREGQFLIYAQMLDFSNVAKQEGGGERKASIWVGTGKGRSVRQAMDAIYATSQQLVFWGHVSSIVFSESALRQGLDHHLIDALIRFREMRYTQWVYGTKEPIEQLFHVVPFFNLSPLSSILNEPEGTYRQRSTLKPIRLQRFISSVREPGETVLLPTLGIDKSTWKKDKKPDPKLYMDGVFAIEQSREVVWLDRSRISGLHWMDEQAKLLQLAIGEHGRMQALLTVDRAKHKLQAKATPDKLVLDIEVEATGKIAELLEEVPVGFIRTQAEAKVEQEIRQTFDYAMKKGVDIYRGEHVLYRKHFPQWSKLTDHGERRISDIELGDVKVKANITQSGMYKATAREQRY